MDSYPVDMGIDFQTNSQLYMMGKYLDVSFPKEVDLNIYDPEKFNELK